MAWKYPESLKPLFAAAVIVTGAAWLAFSFYQQARDVRTFLLGSPLWVGQGLAVALIVAMLLVMQHRAYYQLHPRANLALPAPPKRKLSWWRRLAAQASDSAAQADALPMKGAPQPPSLSDAELARIDHVRGFWGATAKDASSWLLVLITQLLEKPPAKSIFVHLLYHPIGALQNARDRLGGTLVENSRVPLKEVRDRFDEFAKAYMDVVHWVHAFETQDPLVFQNPPHAESYRQWHREHDKLKEKLRELSKRAFLGEFEWALEHHFGANDHLPDTLLARYGNPG